MDRNRITISLSGQDFRIVSSDSTEYIKSLEGMVNRRIAEVQNQYPSMSVNRCTLLAMLNMEDELAKVRANYEALDAKISQLREMPRVNTPSTRAVTQKKPVGV